jgi:hypothetical protein
MVGLILNSLKTLPAEKSVAGIRKFVNFHILRKDQSFAHCVYSGVGYYSYRNRTDAQMQGSGAPGCMDSIFRRLGRPASWGEPRSWNGTRYASSQRSASNARQARRWHTQQEGSQGSRVPKVPPLLRPPQVTVPIPENIFRYECRLPPRTDRPVLVLHHHHL